MYLFLFLYPMLLLLCFVSLEIIKVKDIAHVVLSTWKFFIPVFPVIALLLRYLRTNSNKLGLNHGVFQFLFLAVVPSLFFLYVYFFYKMQLNTTHYNKTAQDPQFFCSCIKSVIVVAIFNEWIIVMLHIIMNHVFFNWIDIIVVPLLRMSITLIIIFIVIMIENIFRKNYPITIRKKINLKNFVVGYGVVVIIFVGVLSTVAVVWFTENSFYYGGLTLLLIVVLGLFSTGYLGTIRRQIVDS